MVWRKLRGAGIRLSRKSPMNSTVCPHCHVRNQLIRVQGLEPGSPQQAFCPSCLHTFRVIARREFTRLEDNFGNAGPSTGRGFKGALRMLANGLARMAFSDPAAMSAETMPKFKPPIHARHAASPQPTVPQKFSSEFRRKR